jgi:hypothetical protein
MGKMEIAPLSRPPRERKPFPTTQALLAVAIVLLAWVGYQQATKPKEKEPEKGWLLPLLEPAKPQVVYVVQKEKPKPPPPAPAKEPDPFADLPVPVIHETVQEVPVKPPPPNAAAVLTPVAPVERKDETIADVTKRCMQLSVEREGVGGSDGRHFVPAITPVIVHAHNACSFDILGDSVLFAVYAFSSNGGVIGMDTGNFSGGIGPGETFSKEMALPANVDQVRNVIVRLTLR